VAALGFYMHMFGRAEEPVAQHARAAFVRDILGRDPLARVTLSGDGVGWAAFDLIGGWSRPCARLPTSFGPPSFMPRPDNDTWIAASCLVHGLSLATFNMKDFADYAVNDGLQLVDAGPGPVRPTRWTGAGEGIQTLTVSLGNILVLGLVITVAMPVARLITVVTSSCVSPRSRSVIPS
jgi:hypothetical protein